MQNLTIGHILANALWFWATPMQCYMRVFLDPKKSLNYLTVCDCDGDAYVDENVGDDVDADDYRKKAK